MRIYVDEDSVHDLLVRLLRSAGHDIQIPSDIWISGSFRSGTFSIFD